MSPLEELKPKIFAKIKKAPDDVRGYDDALEMCRAFESDDKKLSHAYNRELRNELSKHLRTATDKEAFYQCYRRSLLFDAPVDFDAYMLYLEIDRPASERFYMPRRKILKRLVDGMQKLADDELDELFLSMPPRVGKLLADSTPVLTTEGWKNHGDLKAGDMVFSPDGIPVPVLGVAPKHHTTHTVTFTDGTKIKCHFRHEWEVFDRRFGKTRILETQDMIGHLENGHHEGRGHRYNFMIPNKEPLEGVHVNLKVKPYTLGAWLGDGTNRQPRITGVDPEIIEAIVKDGYPVKHTYTHATTGVDTTEFDKLYQALRDYGICYFRERKEKYIPYEYIIAPISDRLELLAGLLDTDGCLRRNERRYDFTTSEVLLKDTFCQLISTFGWRMSVKEVMPHESSSGIVGRKTYWVISFSPTMHIPCRLERKQLFEFSPQRRLAIKSIEESESEQGNCITVAGGMYLAGHEMIPTHNTTILMFYCTWIIGKNSEASNLYSAFSDIITKAFYNGILEIINDPTTYRWADIFPKAKVAATNSQDETINIDRKKRYPSITCRSLYGTLNGACDCNGIEISDDLIGGIEEALNKDRLVAAWAKVDNNLLPRAKEKAKILWCGTRWSIIDPAGIRMDLLQNDERFKNRRYMIINLPALDENDESNFDYDFNVGFSTDYYHQRRASFERNNDMASWNAQYMCEPIERDGALFSPGDMRYYNGVLPDGEPDRVFMAVDPAWGGGDFVAAPVCYQYGADIYVHDVVYDNGDKTVTMPLIEKAVKTHGIQAVQIECTKATESYRENIDSDLRKEGIRVNMTSKAAPTNVGKEQRIFDKSPDIREMMIFRESGKRPKHYEQFMQNVFSFKLMGKNKHDDAPDSLSMAIDMVVNPMGRCEIFKRFF